MRIDADARIGEFRHIGSPDDDEALGFQPRNGRGICDRRRLLLQHHRTGRRHFAGDIEEVLHRNRNAGKPRRPSVTPLQTVHETCSLPRTFFIDTNEGALPLPFRTLDFVKGRLNQGNGGGSSVIEIARNLLDGFHALSLHRLLNSFRQLFQCERFWQKRKIRLPLEVFLEGVFGVA